MGEFNGVRALVTGAGRGIGLAIARAFHAAGARVTINDASEPGVAAGLALLGGAGQRLRGHAADVTDPRAVAAMVATADAAWGGLDVVVNNAGLYPACPVLELDPVEWQRVMDVNAGGTFLVAQSAARGMVARGQGGVIINIASAAATVARPGAAHYCASKAAVVALSRVLALELGPYGIRVNAVAPGLIENDHLSPDYTAAYVTGVPLGRIGRPEEVAAACLMLARPEAAYITGQVLGVDGGVTAGRLQLSGTASR